VGRTLAIVAAGAPQAILYDENNPRQGPGAIATRPGDFCKDGFLPKAARLFENTPLMRSAAPFVADRFNMHCVWDFDVLHAFAPTAAGQQACQDFIGNRPAIIRTGAILMTINFGGTSYSRKYAVGWLTKCDPVKDHGVSCDFHYQLWLPSLYTIA
jgi:hypothetical protein